MGNSYYTAGNGSCKQCNDQEASVIIGFMVITHMGGESVKVVFGDTTIAFNPISKKSKLKATSYGADIALISLNHPDMNGVEQVTRGDKEPFVIDGPGEYEAAGVTVKGVQSASSYDGKERLNTVYVVTLEGMRLCFLGALGSKDLTPELKEVFENIDVLFVPVGDEGVLSPSDAHSVAVKVEAGIIVPIHHGDIGKKDSLKRFLKEEGQEGLKAVDKLTIKKKDVEGKEGEVIVLSS